MPWTNTQKSLAQIVRKQLSWSEEDYQNVLRNVGIKPFDGRISSTHPSADSPAFERFMAIAEKAGFVDSKNGPGYWSKCADAHTGRLINKAHALHAEGMLHHIFEPHTLAGQVERMTQTRPAGPTRKLEECDHLDLYRIIESLKAWLTREARTRGVRLTTTT